MQPPATRYGCANYLHSSVLNVSHLPPLFFLPPQDAHQYGGFTSPPATYQMGTIVDHHPTVPQQDTALEYRTHGSIVGILPTARTAAAGAAAELDINVIKDRLLTTRVPESCV